MRTSKRRRVGGGPRLVAAVLCLGVLSASASSQLPADSMRPAAAAQPEHGLIRGIVLDDSTRAAVAGASVLLLDAAGELTAKIGRTDTAGFFEVVAPTTGEYRLIIRREGYVTVASTPIGIQSGESVELELPIGATAPPRSRALMVGRELISRLGWAPEAFERRRAAGGAGAYSGPRLLRRSRAQPVRELLLRMGWLPPAEPPATLGPSVLAVAREARPSAAACGTELLINGEPAENVDTSTLLLSTAELRAVEYHRAGEVPAELAAKSGCDVVVLWTR